MAVSNGTHPGAEELWRHPDPTSTPMWKFIEEINEKRGLAIKDFRGLYKWSVEEIGPFWEDVWDFVGITASRPADRVSPPSLG